MANYFYLSYASVDNSDYLQRFFEDLTYAIQFRLGLSRDKQVGFFDRREKEFSSHWHGPVTEALRTSRTMVSLLSPAYFRSEYTGKEWQLFDTRRHLCTARKGSTEAERVSTPSVIAPVIWLPWQDHTPKVVSETLHRLGDSTSVYKKNGLLMMRESFQREYVEVVVALAEQIIDMAETTQLRPLDVLPPLNEVDSAFTLSGESSVGFPNETEKVRYKVVVVEDHQQVREMLVEGLRVFGHDATGYAEAESVFLEILPDNRQITMPDLFVIDLELGAGKIQGMDLIKLLRANKVPSAIVAMSASLSSSNFLEAWKGGAADVIAKPFDLIPTVRRMETLANIGMGRRLRSPEQCPPFPTDPSRQDRPVFLSYANADQSIASVLRSHIEAAGIGVWYSLQPEGPCREHILDAIDRALVFVPLITDSYPGSPLCMAEMVRFYRRRITNKSPALLPVLNGLLEGMRNLDLIRPIVEEHQYVDITSERLADGLTALLGLIRKTLVNGSR